MNEFLVPMKSLEVGDKIKFLTGNDWFEIWAIDGLTAVVISNRSGFSYEIDLEDRPVWVISRLSD